MLTYVDALNAFPSHANLTACDRMNATVAECIVSATKLVIEDDFCTAKCPQTCNQTDFKTRITGTAWPRPEYYKLAVVCAVLLYRWHMFAVSLECVQSRSSLAASTSQDAITGRVSGDGNKSSCRGAYKHAV
jgi:hypothetical protein